VHPRAEIDGIDRTLLTDNVTNGVEIIGGLKRNFRQVGPPIHLFDRQGGRLRAKRCVFRDRPSGRTARAFQHLLSLN
jgi:hypothetical protein